jgi:hypothetical protein
MFETSKVVPPAATNAPKIALAPSMPAAVGAEPKLAVPSTYSETRNPVCRPKVR